MTESDFEYLFRTLSEARSRATELTVAVRARAGADHRLADLGQSAVSNIEKLLREVRVLAVGGQPQSTPPVASAPAPAPLSAEHWLRSFIDQLVAQCQKPDEVSFDTVEKLLAERKRTFLDDLETARRMYRVYPHLFRAEVSRPASAG